MRDEVSQYLTFLSIEKGLADNTISAYRADLNLYFDALGFEKLDVPSLEAFVSDLRKLGKAESSISRSVVSLRNFSKFCEKEFKTEDKLFKFVPPKIPKRLPKALPVDQIIKLIEINKNEDSVIAIRDTAILEFLYSTGCRISELAGLDLGNLRDLEVNQTVRVLGKGSKERLVPIGSAAREALNTYLVRSRPTLAKDNREAALFLNSRGKRISRQIVWQTISESAARAKISEKVSPHTFRHSFATHLLDGGADIRVVQELLGHANVGTTQIYTLVTIDKLRENYSNAHPRAK
jgi:integrase/recombinase XerD